MPRFKLIRERAASTVVGRDGGYVVLHNPDLIELIFAVDWRAGHENEEIDPNRSISQTEERVLISKNATAAQKKKAMRDRMADLKPQRGKEAEDDDLRGKVEDAEEEPASGNSR